ncbi:hypothetical protein, partial [Secundilactobacillus kimchicus]|uniref:hypothetical protein n=1 Tax=Secundilactobacillus kimchicus TaxID=528209 RepID=UPI00192CEA67
LIGALLFPLGLLFGGLPFLLSLPLLIAGFLLTKAIADVLALGLAALLTAIPFLIGLAIAALLHFLGVLHLLHWIFTASLFLLGLPLFGLLHFLSKLLKGIFLYPLLALLGTLLGGPLYW